MIIIKALENHLNSGNMTDFYLLCGEENYLKKFYKDKLSYAILNDTCKGNMNYRYYAGSDATPEIIAEQADQMPFFSDALLIVVEESGLFKKSNNLAELLENKADTTKIIFIENNIDKRNNLFKYIQKNGTIFQLDHYTDDRLMNWIGAYLKHFGYMITKSGARALISMSGVDMQMLINEMDKLMSYMGDSKQIEATDVENICTTLLANKIYQMMDFIVSGKQTAALALYADLIAMKEKPMNILFQLTKHLNILIIIKDMMKASENECAKTLSVPSFTIRKYKSQANSYTKRQLIEIMDECISIENDVKSGLIDGQVGVELLIIKLSSIQK